MREIDCRGMSCPHPVLMTKQALENPGEDEVMLVVDHLSSCENIKRFAMSQGCLADVEEKQGNYHIHIRKGTDRTRQEIRLPEKKEEVVVYINSHLLGVGDEALGRFLMKNFLKTLLDLGVTPSRLILINSGVQLAAQESEALEMLTKLSESGTEVLACGTCLDFYRLSGQLKVGTVSNMVEIVRSLLNGSRVIRP